MKIGNIPKKITFFIRKPMNVFFRWDDIDANFAETAVNPCFIADSDKPKNLETGKRWAENYYEMVNGKYIKNSEESRSFEIENTPFENVRVVTLETRERGGRAWKVCADIGKEKNLYFDMREDVLLDIMLNAGIELGAVLEGKFIFARVGSEMKIIRVGSLLHEKMIKSTEMTSTKPIKNLKIGGIYTNKSGERVVYMGKWNTIKPVVRASHDSRYMRKYIQTEIGKRCVAHVFVNVWKDREEVKWFADKEHVVNDYREVGDPLFLHVNVVQNHSYKEMVGELEVPENYMEKLISWYKLKGLAWYGEYYEPSVINTLKVSNLTPIKK